MEEVFYFNVMEILLDKIENGSMLSMLIDL